MFVLCELRKRAETVDTLLLFASNSKEVLEEKKNEFFEQLWEKEKTWAEINDYADLAALENWCRSRMKNFHIVEVPYLEG